MPDERSFCTMIVDDQLFGVDVLQVQEIIGEQHLTPVPLGPPTGVGLLNLRGEIVPAISLRAALGLPPRAEAESCRHVVVRRSSGLASIVVDSIGDVVDVDDASFEPAP